MTTVALVTSIYGSYDELQDPPEQDGVDEYIAVVDRRYDGSRLWRQVIEPRPHMHPRLAAKVAKCCPSLYTNAETNVWIDGGGRLLHPGVVEWAVAHGQYAQWVHPERQEIVAEAEVSAGMIKYREQPVREQVAWYHQDGLPFDWGLWATGFIVRPRWWPCGESWLVEQMRWTYQDQLSLPWLLWKVGVRPAPLEGSLWSNPHVRFTGHASEQ